MRLIPKIRCRQALRINLVRRWIGHWRLRWATWFGNVRTLDSDQSVKETLQHNMKSLADFSNNRIELLIRPLSVIETARDATSVLLIGPRNENDLLIASAFFDLPLDCIRGLDLISYSKQIDLGDMHDMPYENDQFDVVICGWTLSYSNDPQRLADEMMRVCRPKGLIAVGVEYSELDEAGYQELLGYSLKIPGVDRINTADQIQKLFAEHLGKVHFSHDAPLKLCHRPEGRVDRPSSVASIFSIDKPKAA
ncbi:MAG: class I SAM-dependent methyltransferase [Planctomycetota bacterium]